MKTNMDEYWKTADFQSQGNLYKKPINKTSLYKKNMLVIQNPNDLPKVLIPEKFAQT
jgi:hypothetical protein